MRTRWRRGAKLDEGTRVHRRDLAKTLLASVAADLTSEAPAQAGDRRAYPRTPAEISAHVTPVNTDFPPHDVLRYGADPSGIQSSQAAFAAAIATALVSSGGCVRVPCGTYLLQASLRGVLKATLRISGDGPGVTTIIHTKDDHLFDFSLAEGQQGRLIVENLKLVANTGRAMANGRAISIRGYARGHSPARTLIVWNVIISGAGGNDEFRYGIWANAVCGAFVSNVCISGRGGSSSGVGIHIEATTAPSLACDILALQVADTHIGLEIASAAAPGVEGVKLIDCDFVGVQHGVKAVNALALATYAPPQLLMVGCHVNSTGSCVDISSFIQVTITGGLLYRSGAGGAFVRFEGVQFFAIDIQSTVLGTTDVPVLSLDGSGAACANGELNGFFQGKQGAKTRVVAAVGSMYQVRVRGAMNGYSGWIPDAAEPGYKGTLFCSASDVIPVTADELSVTVTPGAGPDGSGTLDLTFVQAPCVIINATALRITRILAHHVGQRVCLFCEGPGVILEHHPGQIMPGGIDHAFGTGKAIELYCTSSGVWRALR
jgi:Pectate lyase superfamily protein